MLDSQQGTMCQLKTETNIHTKLVGSDKHRSLPIDSHYSETQVSGCKNKCCNCLTKHIYENKIRIDCNQLLICHQDSSF